MKLHKFKDISLLLENSNFTFEKAIYFLKSLTVTLNNLSKKEKIELKVDAYGNYESTSMHDIVDDYINEEPSNVYYRININNRFVEFRVDEEEGIFFRVGNTEDEIDSQEFINVNVKKPNNPISVKVLDDIFLPYTKGVLLKRNIGDLSKTQKNSGIF